MAAIIFGSRTGHTHTHIHTQLILFSFFGEKEEKIFSKALVLLAVVVVVRVVTEEERFIMRHGHRRVPVPIQCTHAQTDGRTAWN